MNFGIKNVVAFLILYVFYNSYHQIRQKKNFCLNERYSFYFEFYKLQAQKCAFYFGMDAMEIISYGPTPRFARGTCLEILRPTVGELSQGRIVLNKKFFYIFF